jgi:hypothetical protein
MAKGRYCVSLTLPEPPMPPFPLGGEIIPGEVVPRAPIRSGTAMFMLPVAEGGFRPGAGERVPDLDGEGTLSLQDAAMMIRGKLADYEGYITPGYPC